MFLYAEHFQGAVDFVLVHIWASLGDILVFSVIYIIGVAIYCSFRWPFQPGGKGYLFAAITGFVIAVIIEKMALSSGRWEYNELMPIIPFFKIGLSPVFQMMILPVVVLRYVKYVDGA